MNDPAKKPLVSIITATYNRSNVLKLAIKSVLKSSYENWEMIIISDASTDNTTEVVNSFDDPRIRFFELEENVGVQSGPNNEGLKHAKGELIAYLSHDDLWFPDHLENMVKTLVDTSSDWIFSQGFNIVSDKRVTVSGIFPTTNYDPKYNYVVASLWLVRKNVLEELGGWKLSYEIRLIPSQDLLIRAYNAGKKIRMHSEISVVIFPSGMRKFCYTDGSASEQEHYFNQILNNPKLKEELLHKAFVFHQSKKLLDSFKIYYTFKRLVIAVVKRIGCYFKISPVELSALIKHRKKGSYIDKIRKYRGLEPINHSKK